MLILNYSSSISTLYLKNKKNQQGQINVIWGISLMKFYNSMQILKFGRKMIFCSSLGKYCINIFEIDIHGFNSVKWLSNL